VDIKVIRYNQLAQRSLDQQEDEPLEASLGTSLHLAAQ
jgi:hypothetical protein